MCECIATNGVITQHQGECSKRHKHAKLIIAWANGAEIEWKNSLGEWQTAFDPSWYSEYEYRLKPQAPDYAEIARDAYMKGIGSLGSYNGWQLAAKAVIAASKAWEQK